MAKPAGASGTAAPQEHLPIIDLSSDDEGATASQLLKAATECGFVYVRGVGLAIEAGRLDSIFALAEMFFQLPTTEKAKCRIGPETQDRGWGGPHVEFGDEDTNKKGDFKEFVGPLPERCCGLLRFCPVPNAFIGRVEEIGRFFELCRRICLRFYELFAVVLKIPADEGGKAWFTSRHDPNSGASGSILRLLYYPVAHTSTPLPDSAATTDQVRCSPHTDFGGLTLLFQRPGQPGLEIQAPLDQTRRGEASWLPVAVQPPGTEHDPFPPIVVNIGDLLSHWSAGMLRSTPHRVVLPRQQLRERYSVAFFCHPAKTTRLVPVPSSLIAERRGEGKGAAEHAPVLTAEEHLQQRLAETYGWKS